MAALAEAVEAVVARAQGSSRAPDPPPGAPRLAPTDPLAGVGGTVVPVYSFAAAAEPPRVPSADGASGVAAAASLGGPDDGAELRRGPQDPAAPGRSLLDGLLLAMWADAASKGLFRYDVTACPTRILPGSLGFVAQLNEGRATKKRPTEFKMDEVGGRGRG
jgi:hypothetical protein